MSRSPSLTRPRWRESRLPRAATSISCPWPSTFSPAPVADGCRSAAATMACWPRAVAALVRRRRTLRVRGFPGDAYLTRQRLRLLHDHWLRCRTVRCHLVSTLHGRRGVPSPFGAAKSGRETAAANAPTKLPSARSALDRDRKTGQIGVADHLAELPFRFELSGSQSASHKPAEVSLCPPAELSVASGDGAWVRGSRGAR